MTEDEHPNERLVTPSEGGGGFDRSLVSRRSMLGGSALLAGLLAYTSDPTQPTNPNVGVARASHNPDEPLIILGPESDPVGYIFQDTAGGIILQDATSGNHFWYNESQGRWETDAELDVPTLTAESLVIGGTLYEEDDNSPIDVNTSSHQYTVAGTYDDIIIIGDPDGVGFDQLQVNGDGTSNYDFIDNSDTQTTGANQWTIPRVGQREWIHLIANGGAEINFSALIAESDTGLPVGGSNANVSGPIDTFTLIDSGGVGRSLKARVFGRAMGV